MKKNRLKFWSYLVVGILLYGGFLTYFCMAKPCEPNNIVIEQEKTSGKNTSTAKNVGPEFYLSEITNFYETVIIILSTVIFVILGLIFFYSMRISKNQAEEVVMEAMGKKTFDYRLKEMISERFIESKNKGDIAGILEGLEEIDERIKFLEEQINIQSYDESGDEESAVVS